jgi:protein TonB
MNLACRLLLAALVVCPPMIPAQTTASPESGRVYRSGDDVQQPTLLFAPDPEFNELVRKARISGKITVGLVVDTEGNPQQVHIVNSITSTAAVKNQQAAQSMDEEALKAVRRYRYNPALHDGKPVPYELSVDINFQIF